MSDEFIPLNQSTPMGGSGGNEWHGNRNNYRGHNNRHQNQSGFRRSQTYNRWGNNSQRNNSFRGGSDASNNSFSPDKNNINLYLHPSMLQDPWAELRRQLDNS